MSQSAQTLLFLLCLPLAGAIGVPFLRWLERRTGEGR